MGEKEVKELGGPVSPGVGDGSPGHVPATLPPPSQEVEKPRRGRKPKSPTLAERGEESGELDRLFSPENFRALAVIPGETACALTGWDGFLISKEEEKSLAVTASQTARHYMADNPKYVALTLLAVNILVIYGTRAVAYYQEKRKREDAGKPKP